MNMKGADNQCWDQVLDRRLSTPQVWGWLPVLYSGDSCEECQPQVYKFLRVY